MSNSAASMVWDGEGGVLAENESGSIHLDQGDMESLLTLYLDGICALCWRDIPAGHRLCAGCAAEEAEKWK